MTGGFQLTQTYLQQSLNELAARAPEVLYGVSRYGFPKARRAPVGFSALVRALAGQQLSVKAAATIFARVEAHLGADFSAARVMRTRVATYRRLGLSERKAEALRALGQAVDAGALPLDGFGALSDEQVVAHIAALKGFGLWSAQMYLLFSLGRPDVWPSGDLGVRHGLALLLQRSETPTPAEVATLGLAYAPYRSSVALLCWHAKNATPAS